MSVLRLSRDRIGAIETALGVPALLLLAKVVDSVFGVMCDPRIKVAGAPPFGSTSIYGAPVWAALPHCLAYRCFSLGTGSPSSSASSLWLWCCRWFRFRIAYSALA